MVEERTRFWIGFNLVKGIGPTRLQHLINYFGDIQRAWEASPSELQAAELGERFIQSLIETRMSSRLDETMELLHQKDIRVLTWEDPNYPRRLKEVNQSPPVLYLQGELLAEDHWAVAIVGTRRISTYGRQVAEQLGAELAQNGITVVSGLARGIDATAHQACLKNGGRTLAVLGCGVDIVYPPEHRQLAQQVIANGALISDYPPGTAPEAINFPPRNRIISGLSQAVVVVEAGKKSGALITAAFAAEQGRQVFAIPGNIYAPLCKGPNQLIYDGAQILPDTKTLLEALEVRQVKAQQSARKVLPADATEAQLYDILGHEPLHVDEIGAKSGLPIAVISASLTLMELKGMVRQVGNMRYVAAFEERAEYKLDGESQPAEPEGFD